MRRSGSSLRPRRRRPTSPVESAPGPTRLPGLAPVAAVDRPPRLASGSLAELAGLPIGLLRPRTGNDCGMRNMYGFHHARVLVARAHLAAGGELPPAAALSAQPGSQRQS